MPRRNAPTTATTHSRPENVAALVAAIRHTNSAIATGLSSNENNVPGTFLSATRTSRMAIERIRDTQYPGSMLDYEGVEERQNFNRLLHAAQQAERQNRFR